MQTDTVADLLTRIRNAQARNTDSFEMPYSKMNESIAKVLAENGFLQGVHVFKQEKSTFKGLRVELKYDGEQGAIRYLQRVSKPSLRNYVKARDLKPVLGGLGMYILSTSRGIVSSKEAGKRNLGGELVCKVY